MLEKRSYANYIGIDVGKYKLDLYNTKNNAYNLIKNKEEDINNYIATISDIDKGDTLVVIDLTGGYEKLVANLFYKSGFTNIILAEGFKVKNFTKSTKHNKAKTDKIDCQSLIYFAKYFTTQQDNKFNFYTPTDDDMLLLTQLYSRIEDMKITLQKEKNRLKQPNISPVMEESVKKQIEFFKIEIDILKQKMEDIIKNNEELNITYNTLMSQKGIKNEISLFLLIKLRNELGKIQRKQLSSICGLAPIPFDSGKTVRGHRYTRGGRKDIKSKLYFCVLSMIRYNQQFKSKMAEFVSKGKNKKVALIALARKLITQLNAIVRNALQKAGFIK
ncbi:MAG: transposase [Rickettsiales bacterium]|jgi:transposase|nr:transposase [Rickettsiales bacterium]